MPVELAGKMPALRGLRTARRSVVHELALTRPALFPFFPVAFAGSTLFLFAVFGRLIKYWLPLILWMCLIFSASTKLGSPHNTSYFFRPLMHWLFPGMSEETLEHIHHYVRKTAHFVEYAVLGFLVWRAVQFDPAFASFSPARRFWFALLLCLFYASTDEFHQIFVPGREAAVKDVLLDTCGSGCALLVIGSVRKLRAAA
jgi:VanZ family protein